MARKPAAEPVSLLTRADEPQRSAGTRETVTTETTGDTQDVDPWADVATADARTDAWHLAEDRALTRLGMTRDVVAWQ